MSEKAKKLLNQLIDIPQVVVSGKVQAVDLANLTCEVVERNDGGADLLAVRLRPVLDGADDGLLVVPAEGSVVTMLMLDEHTPLLIATSVVQLYSVRTEKESLKAVLHDVLAALEVLTVTTTAPGSPTSVPINAGSFTAIKTRLNNLFHS